jgi:hypothetical protein
VTGTKRSRDGSEPAPAVPSRLDRPFKAPTMAVKNHSIQDQNASNAPLTGVAFKKPDVPPNVRPAQRPPIQPLTDRTRHLNSNTTSTSTSSSTLTSAAGDVTDTGNDSFEDDAEDMEGLLMGGGAEVEALFRACDGI